MAGFTNGYFLILAEQGRTGSYACKREELIQNFFIKKKKTKPEIHSFSLGPSSKSSQTSSKTSYLLEATFILFLTLNT